MSSPTNTNTLHPGGQNIEEPAKRECSNEGFLQKEDAESHKDKRTPVDEDNFKFHPEVKHRAAKVLAVTREEERDHHSDKASGGTWDDIGFKFIGDDGSHHPQSQPCSTEYHGEPPSIADTETSVMSNHSKYLNPEIHSSKGSERKWRYRYLVLILPLVAISFVRHRSGFCGGVWGR
jgi:hypothetical protein